MIGLFLFKTVIDKIFATAQLSSNASILLYANGLCYVKSFPSDESVTEAQEDINHLHGLYQSTGLRINPKKSKVLVVSASSQDAPRIQISLQNVPIPQVTFLCYLGVMLDQSLSFGLHDSSEI